MTHKKIKLYIVSGLSFLLLAASVWFFHCIDTRVHHTGPFSTIQADISGHKVDVWYDEQTNEWLLFLPSHATSDTVTISTSLPKRLSLFLDEEPINNGDLLPLGSHHIQIQNSRGQIREEGTLTVLHSENVPTIYIQTKSGSMVAVQSNKKNREDIQLTIVNADGIVENTATGAIRGHGNSTWQTFEKKPYNLYFDNPLTLLGMDSADKWVLQANALDASHLRVSMAMNMALDAQVNYAPQCTHADVYFNGEYAGLYLLSQAVTTPEDTALIERDSKFTPGEVDSFTTKNDDIFQIHTYSDMNSQQIATLVQQCESAIFSNQLTGLDVDSLVLKYMIDEISKDPDAANFSAYYYLRNNILYGGPVWDYDRSFGCRHPMLGNNYIRSQTPRGLSYCFNTWFTALYQNEIFFEKILLSYEQTFRPLLMDLCNGKLASDSETIQGAALMNQRRWHTSSWATEVEYLLQWLEQRIAFLDEVWLQEKTYHTVVYVHDYHSYYAIADESTLAESLTGILPETVYRADGTIQDLTEPVQTALTLYRDNPSAPNSSTQTPFSGITKPMLMAATLFLLLVISCGILIIVDLRRNRNRKGG